MADAFEAMTADRPYRMTPLTPEQALGELRKFAGIQFDPVIVDAFVRTTSCRGGAGSRPTAAPADPAPLAGCRSDDHAARRRTRPQRTGLTDRPCDAVDGPDDLARPATHDAPPSQRRRARDADGAVNDSLPRC